MNFIKLLFVITVANLGIANAQTVQDVFSNTKMTWYGLDFSQAKFAGDFASFNAAGIKNGVQLRDTYFRSWNNVIVNEKAKYNIPDFYNKSEVVPELSVVDTFNSKVNTDSMMLPWGTAKELTKMQIQEEINRYNSKGKTGLGLVFIVESFDKTKELGTIHVTFFDIATNKVLLSKRVQTSPRGIGLRNYWISTALFTMDESKSNWKKWKKEAGVK